LGKSASPVHGKFGEQGRGGTNEDFHQRGGRTGPGGGGAVGRGDEGKILQTRRGIDLREKKRRSKQRESGASAFIRIEC